MRIRQNSEFANLHYLHDVCILNQDPRDILGPWIESESQIDGENDDFCGLASFGNTVKDLLREIEEGKDKTDNEQAVHCTFTDTPNGFNCGAEAHAGSQYCEVHVQLPTTSRTCSGTGKSRAKKVNKQQKRKKASDPGDEMVYYAGFPGLRRKRGPHRSEQEAAAAVNNADEVMAD